MTHDYLVPSLRDWLTRKQKETRRGRAELLLADYAADNTHVLAELLMDADDKQFAVIYPKLADRSEQGLPLLADEIDKKIAPDLPSSDMKREKLAKRQANAAVALLRMNHPEKVWPLLRHSPDPRVRSYLIDRLSPLGAEAGEILKRFDEEPDISIRRALLLSLGGFGEKELPFAARQAWSSKLQDVYRTEPDPGLHAAAEWLLRQWKATGWLQQLNEEWAKDKVKGGGWWEESKNADSAPLTRHPSPTSPKWYVNGHGQTMVVIPGPVEFLMGSPATEKERSPNESQHMKRIGRTFAVAAKLVTVKDFRRFLQDTKLKAGFDGTDAEAAFMKKYSPEEDCPIIKVSWYGAALYCNWLSEQEGIPLEQWCYETNGQKLLHENMGAGLMLLLQRNPLAAAGTSSYFVLEREPEATRLRKNYLSLTGYRLPTEAELEYATRAGALTSRYYGETEELLPKYAWYSRNSQERSWPVGSLKPNDFGFFDVHGNVYTWCQERYKSYPQSNAEAQEDHDDIYSIDANGDRLLRGGSFLIQASEVRSAFRNNLGVPSSHYYDYGFRLARTFR